MLRTWLPTVGRRQSEPTVTMLPHTPHLSRGCPCRCRDPQRVLAQGSAFCSKVESLRLEALVIHIPHTFHTFWQFHNHSFGVYNQNSHLWGSLFLLSDFPSFLQGYSLVLLKPAVVTHHHQPVIIPGLLLRSLDPEAIQKAVKSQIHHLHLSEQVFLGTQRDMGLLLQRGEVGPLQRKGTGWKRSLWVLRPGSPGVLTASPKRRPTIQTGRLEAEWMMLWKTRGHQPGGTPTQMQVRIRRARS